jgi:hypothetical protein
MSRHRLRSTTTPHRRAARLLPEPRAISGSARFAQRRRREVVDVARDGRPSERAGVPAARGVARASSSLRKMPRILVVLVRSPVASIALAAATIAP